MHYILEILPSLLSGAGMTLQIFLWTLIGSLPLGLILSLGLISKINCSNNGVPRMSQT